jgi:hypothetical protein
MPILTISFFSYFALAIELLKTFHIGPAGFLKGNSLGRVECAT